MANNKKQSTSVLDEKKNLDSKKSDISVSNKKEEIKNEDSPTSNAKAYSEIKKDNIESIVEQEEKIIYSKYNKFIFKTPNNNSFGKQHNLIYNFSKFGLAITLTVFLLISLWMSTIWQKDTLVGLNVNIAAMNTALGGDILTKEVIAAMNAKNIMQFAGLTINASIIDSIMAIGIISLFTLIPILVFKNGTLLSVVSLSLGFVFLITIMSLFFYVINDQGELVAIAREGNYLASLGEPTAADTARLNDILLRIISIVG
ncbi:MAG: hypothetical protein ACRDCF_00950 [Mycoplasmoidaceae bacterium]